MLSHRFMLMDKIQNHHVDNWDGWNLGTLGTNHRPTRYVDFLHLDTSAINHGTEISARHHSFRAVASTVSSSLHPGWVAGLLGGERSNAPKKWCEVGFHFSPFTSLSRRNHLSTVFFPHWVFWYILSSNLISRIYTNSDPPKLQAICQRFCLVKVCS